MGARLNGACLARDIGLIVSYLWAETKEKLETGFSFRHLTISTESAPCLRLGLADRVGHRASLSGYQHVRRSAVRLPAFLWMPPDLAILRVAKIGPDAIATIIRVTNGNFRLLHRLLTQIERILEINSRTVLTKGVVEAERETLVIGQV